MATARPDELNPFRAPTAAIGTPTLAGASTDAESIRLYHLKHEASVKSVGTLAYCGAGFLLLLAIFYAALAAGIVPGMDRGGGEVAYMRVMMAVAGGFCLLGVAVLGGTGYGLRRLQAWSRWLTLVLAVLLVGVILVGFVSAALINVQIVLVLSLVYAIPLLMLGGTIYYMAAPKANMVFSAGYRDVIRETPHLRYRSGLIYKIAVGLIVGVIAFFVIVALVGGVR